MHTYSYSADMIVSDQVCVIGSGVGGLLTAIACVALGIDVRVFERADNIGGVWANGGAASAHSLLQQPAEYYSVDSTPLPSRFPSAPVIRQYLHEVALRNRIIDRIELSAEVLDVQEVREGESIKGLAVTWRPGPSSGAQNSMTTSHIIFMYVVLFYAPESMHAFIHDVLCVSTTWDVSHND